MTRLIVAAFLTTFFVLLPGRAADIKDVQKVIDLMARTKKMVKRRRLADGLEVVLRINGRRYTLWYSGGNQPSLSVWAAFKQSSRDILTFSDDQLDGTVDYGITIGASERTRRHYVSELCTLLPRQGINVIHCSASAPIIRGEEYKAYWQREYDRAIKEVLLVLQ